MPINSDHKFYKSIPLLFKYDIKQNQKFMNTSRLIVVSECRVCFAM